MSAGFFRRGENIRKWVVAYNEGKCKPSTKANNIHDMSRGVSDANMRDREFTVPVNRAHRVIHSPSLQPAFAPRDAALNSLQLCW